MSIYSSSTTWACPTTDQSPINLSQASSKPCDLLCELVMDDVMIPQANVIISDEGLIIQSTAGLGSCKYNGEGYTCSMILVNHPSHHTIENIQADAEVIAVFTNPSEKMLCVSSLVRVNSTQTDATKFFNAFVGYANPSQQYTPVNLGESWGVNMMVPPNGAYFVYDGSMVAPPCQSVKWVVFKSMINIDPNDFALLTKNVSPGSRPVQPVGDREVFFNEIDHLPGGPMPNDNKTYMKCRRAGGGKGPTTGGVASHGGGLLGGGKKTGDITSLDAKSKESENKSKKVSGVHKFVKDQIATNGIISLVDLIITVGAVLIGLYYGSKSDYSSTGMILMRKAQDLASYLRSFIIRPSAPIVTSSS